MRAGESPRWDSARGLLYWVDILRGELLRCDLSAAHIERYAFGAQLGACTIQEDGALLLFMARGTIKRWTPSSLEVIVPQLDDELDSRFNDVVADARGRVLAGTMPAPQRDGRHYRVDLDGSVSRLRDGLRLPNGMGFLSSGELVYVDTGRKTLYVADYELATGSVGASRILFRVPPRTGFPDGIAIDEEDGIWVALHGAGAVARFSRDGRETHRIQVPNANVTAVSFAGDALDELVITSAAVPGSISMGVVYRVATALHGQPSYVSRISAPTSRRTP